MDDKLIKQLRDNAEFLVKASSGCLSNSFADTMVQAADTIEELSRAADAIPHICECCIGCEVESGGCDNAFVLSPKRAKEYLSKPRWISVTERLPEVGQRVMAVGLHGEAMYIGTYTGGIKETEYRKAKPCKITAHGYGWRTFTYWMPLPEPPKAEEGE